MDADSTAWEEVPGTSSSVRQLDHTADVGLEVRAPSLEALLVGALDGMTGLILGDDRPGEEEERTVEARGADGASLLRNLLREMLFLHEAEGFAAASATARTSREEDGELRAWLQVRGGEDPGPPHRELKGVTLHGLRADRQADGSWLARVIFDV